MSRSRLHGGHFTILTQFQLHALWSSLSRPSFPPPLFVHAHAFAMSARTVFQSFILTSAWFYVMSNTKPWNILYTAAHTRQIPVASETNLERFMDPPRAFVTSVETSRPLSPFYPVSRNITDEPYTALVSVSDFRLCAHDTNRRSLPENRLRSPRERCTADPWLSRLP